MEGFVVSDAFDAFLDDGIVPIVYAVLLGTAMGTGFAAEWGVVAAWLQQEGDAGVGAG